MKNKRNDYDLLLETLSRMQDEKASQGLLIESLRNEISVMRESHAQEMAALRESFAMSIDSMRMTIEHLSATNADLAAQLANAQAGGKLARGKRFAPTTEQRDLLNNRSTDRRAEEKDDFDGTPPSAPAGNADQPKPQTKKKKKSQGRKPAKEDYGCDEVVRHPLGEYFTLPPGARLKTRDGEVEIHIYEYYEYIPGRIVLHQYETATYVDAMGDCHNTLPAAERDNPVHGCPFSPEMLSFILTEKYAYHTPKNRIKTKLREMGASFSKSTFTRHCQLAERMLRDAFGDVLQLAAMDSRYLMIDEICRTLLDEIEPLFINERQFKGMDPTERMTRRQRLSLPVLNRIFAMIERVATDTAEMGKEPVPACLVPESPRDTGRRGQTSPHA